MWHTECAPYTYGASHVALVVKNQPASAEYVRDVGWITESGRSLGRAHGNHSSILARRIPWTEEPGRLHSVGSQRVGHYWSDLTYTHTYTYCPNSTGSIKILQHYTYFPFFFINSKEDFIICFFGCTESWAWNVGSSFFTEAWGIFPDKGCNLGPLHWELRVLATRPPWKPLRFYYLKSRRFREESRGLYFGVGQRSWSFLFCFCLCLVT